MRVTWSPSRPGLSPNVPKSGPSCPRTFCSPSLSWVSHLLPVFPITVTMLCSKKNPQKQQLAFPTTEHRVLVIQSIIMPLACHVRRRSHLCSLREPDCGMFGCLDLLWLFRHLLVFAKLSAALDKQPWGNVVIIAGSRGSTQGGLMRKKDKSSNEGKKAASHLC